MHYSPNDEENIQYDIVLIKKGKCKCDSTFSFNETNVNIKVSTI